MLKPRQYGKYILIDRISAGGMAEVYLAKSTGVKGFEKVLAIKRILPAVSEDPDFETMFIDEAKISARLSHSNVGQIFEFGQVEGQYYIAMEYISGRDLRAIQTHLTETERVMDVPMTLHIVSRVAQALDYAHRHKGLDGEPMEIVHRDISPPNVIVSYEGSVKLIDFGIAKATSRATRTRAGKLKGKFSYMSPEQVQGKPIDHRSDVFSLGTLLHELLTNQRLFHGETQLDTMHQVRRAEVDPPSTINPEVPLEIDTIVLKALARDRDQRYGWASELRADIERYFARSGLIFETSHLARWMRSEFAGDVEAERRLKERIHGLKLDADAGDDDDGEDPTVAARPTQKPAAPAPNAPSTPAPSAAAPPRTAEDATRDVPVSGAAGDLEMPDGPGDKPSDEPEDDATEAYAPGLRFNEEPVAGDATDAGAAPPPAAAAEAEPGELGPTDEQPRLDQASVQPGSGRKDTLRDPDRPGEPAMQEPLAHGDRTDEHAMDLPLPSPAAVAAAVPPQGDAAPEGGQPAGEAPQVLGPEETKQHQGELVDWPTQLHSDEQLAPGASGDADEAELVDQATMIESEEAIKARHSGAIAPGPGREGSVVGGAVEVDSDPSKRLKVEATPDGIDVAGIDGVVSTDEFVMPPHGQVSGTQELSEQMKPAPRFTSLQVMILAGGITLLLAAVITLVVLLAGNGDDGSEVPVRPEGPSGSIIVTARPHAACTIALDGKAKGLLSPGTSLSVPGTPVGKHTITVTCVGGFKPYTTAIEVKRAKVTFVEAMLKKE